MGTQLYLDGRLDEADAQFRAAIAADPKDWLARRVLGRILMLRNRLKDAQDELWQAVKLSAAADRRRVPDMVAAQDLAWTLYRMDDYAKAAWCFSLLNEAMLAKKCDDMSKVRPPYTPSWRGEAATVRFLERGPLAIVELRVNGRDGRFLVDTSAGDVVLNRAFAKAAGAKTVGTEEGYVDTVGLPGLEVRNVPVVLRKLEPLFGTREIDGILGAGFLAHFNVTIDFRGEGRMVFRPLGSAPASGRGQELPLLLGLDRYLVVPVAIDDKPAFAFVHTAAAGRAFVASRAGAVNQPTMKQVLAGTLAPAVARTTVKDREGKEIEVPATDGFPGGLDTTFGFLISGMLGPEAFRGRAITFDMDRMKLVIE